MFSHIKREIKKEPLDDYQHYIISHNTTFIKTEKDTENELNSMGTKTKIKIENLFDKFDDSSFYKKNEEIVNSVVQLSDNMEETDGKNANANTPQLCKKKVKKKQVLTEEQVERKRQYNRERYRKLNVEQKERIKVQAQDHRSKPKSDEQMEKLRENSRRYRERRRKKGLKKVRTKEQIERRRDQMREYCKKLTPEKKEERRQKMREYRKKLGDEHKEQTKLRMREYRKKIKIKKSEKMGQKTSEYYENITPKESKQNLPSLTISRTDEYKKTLCTIRKEKKILQNECIKTEYIEEIEVGDSEEDIEIDDVSFYKHIKEEIEDS